MEFNYQIRLIKEIDPAPDEYGNYEAQFTDILLLADKRSITRSEFYNAAQAGMQPEIVFIINRFEYSGEEIVEFEGVRYAVIRTYESNPSSGTAVDETLELVCTRKINNVDTNRDLVSDQDIDITTEDNRNILVESIHPRY